MTPQQRRRHNGALSEVAVAAHKRYLGRPELLTGIQSAWIKSLLTMWGKAYAVVQPQAYQPFLLEDAEGHALVRQSVRALYCCD
jgi:hypothetical protein